MTSEPAIEGAKGGGKVAVVGSLNVDYTLGVSRLPKPGETVGADWSLTCFGGKGANQALAAARAGGRVAMVGCVGNDDPGTNYRAYLSGEGIEVTGISTAPAGVATGSAFIVVDGAGENLIVVDPGANGIPGEELADENAALIAAADVLLVQLECPLPVVRRAAEIARAAGVSVVVNPSPWNGAFSEAGIACDYLIANASEAARYLGEEVFDRGSLGLEILSKNGLRAMVVTQGGGPTICLSQGGGIEECAPPPVSPVDTVGAGDSFAGAFAVALAEGRPLREAVDFGNVSGSLATLKKGAQSAIPTRAEIEAHLAGWRR